MNQPNILLITIDCFRYDRCGFNGYQLNTTPFLDNLATQSTVFDTAYATGPYTAESFPGILAGRHGDNSPYYSKPVLKGLPGDEPTLATELQDAGYETRAVLTNPHLTPDRNFDRGFESFENIRAEETESGDGSSEPGRISKFLTNLRNRGRWGEDDWVRLLYAIRRYRQLWSGWPSLNAETVLNRFSSSLEEVENEPFFGWTHLMDLHGPIHPDTVRKGELTNAMRTTDQLRYDAARWANRRSGGYESMYDSAVRYVDDQIQRFVRELEDRGRMSNTVLIVTGDHGEALYDRGIYGHPYHYMYDELLRVPLLVRTPDDTCSKVQRPFSLAWLHELIGEQVDSFESELPACGWNSETEDTDSQGYVIADSLTEHGHTIAIRDEKKQVRPTFWRRTIRGDAVIGADSIGLPRGRRL